MAVSASDQAAIAELFEFVPELRLRRMFGGVGIFTGDMMFALATQDGLFLRDDPESAPAYAARGLAPFTWRDKGGNVHLMGYRAAPDEIWDDPDATREWAQRAIGAALRRRA